MKKSTVKFFMDNGHVVEAIRAADLLKEPDRSKELKIIFDGCLENAKFSWALNAVAFFKKPDRSKMTKAVFDKCVEVEAFDFALGMTTKFFRGSGRLKRRKVILGGYIKKKLFEHALKVAELLEGLDRLEGFEAVLDACVEAEDVHWAHTALKAITS